MVAMSHSESIKDAKKIFETIDLLAEYNAFINFKSVYVEGLRGKNYVEQWELYTKNYWFNLKLNDGSLIVFEESSYRYIMAPINIPKVEEFLHNEFGGEWDCLDEEEQSQYLSSSEFSMDYQNYIDSVSSFIPFTPIRYDLSLEEEEYCKYSHPAFHLHVGFENNSRIPVKVRLTPLAFAIFVLSTFYPVIWKQAVQDELIDDETFKKIKATLSKTPQLKSDLWCNDFEERRLYLG